MKWHNNVVCNDIRSYVLVMHFNLLLIGVVHFGALVRPFDKNEQELYPSFTQYEKETEAIQN